MVELASIIILGIFSQWLAWRLKVPAILPLIIIGLLVGPISTYWTSNGEKWLEPRWNNTFGLFAGDYLYYFVELSIGLILFEGGLTLKKDEVRGVGPTILKLISVGSLITFIGGAIAAHYLIGIDWMISFLFSALIIVTGPTVIMPILRNISLKKTVATVLKWEGILIDPLGALVAVLVFELILSFERAGAQFQFTEVALRHFINVLLVGFSTGMFGAFAFREIIRRNWVPHYLLNVFTLAFVLSVFVGSDYLSPESGLLALVVMGMILANINVPHIKEILNFKESVSILLISILFILLSANMNMSDLQLVLNWRSLFLFLLIILLLRPLSVFVSTQGSALSLNDKLFICWVGPRGIVAAGIASLFGLKLVGEGLAGAQYITPLVFMVVLGTVLLNATTAGFIARILKVKLKKSNGILIVGINTGSRLIGKYLQQKEKQVVMVDNNNASVEKAIRQGLNAHQANVYTDDLSDIQDMHIVGYTMAMTSSNELNQYAIEKYKRDYGELGAYRLISAEELKHLDNIPDFGLFSSNNDFINFNEIARDYPNFHEIPVTNNEEYENAIEILNRSHTRAPVFFELENGNIQFITISYEPGEIKESSRLIYLGEELEKI